MGRSQRLTVLESCAKLVLLETAMQGLDALHGLRVQRLSSQGD